MICSLTKKPVSGCGCEGLRCAIVTSSNEDNDVACHKPAIRYIGSSLEDGLCADCLNEMAQGGDFPLDKVDEIYPLIGGQ